MTLLSGNPDGFDFVFESQHNNKGQQINHLLPLSSAKILLMPQFNILQNRSQMLTNLCAAVHGVNFRVALTGHFH